MEAQPKPSATASAPPLAREVWVRPPEDPIAEVLTIARTATVRIAPGVPGRRRLSMLWIDPPLTRRPSSSCSSNNLARVAVPISR